MSVDPDQWQAARLEVDRVLQQARQVITSDLAQVLALTNEAQRLLTRGVLAEQPYLGGQAWMLLYAGIVYFYRSEYEIAAKNLTEAHILFEHLGDEDGLAHAPGVLGSISREMGDYAGALEWYDEQLVLCRRRKDRAGEARALHGLASVYSQLNEPARALEYLRQAQPIVREQSNPYLVATLLGHMCTEYLRLGSYDEALEAGQASLRLFQQMEQGGINEAQTLLALARVHRRQLRLVDALAAIHRALALSHDHTAHAFRLQALLEQGHIYVLQHKKDAARRAFLHVLDEARLLNAEKSVYETHLALMELYKSEGQYEQALHHHEAYHRLKESLFTAESDRRIRALEIRQRVEATRTEVDYYRQHSAELEARHRQEQQYLERLNQLKDDLLRSTSHDLQSPLGSIITALYILQKHGRIDDERGQRYLQRIQELTLHMSDLLQDVVDLMKLETGRALDMARVPFNPLLQELPQALHTAAARQQVGLLVAPLPEDVPILGDVRRLRQALHILALHSLQLAHPGTCVQVAARVQDHRLTLQIEHEGVALLAEDLPHVFDRFYRLRRTDGQVLESTGLRLTIARSIIDQHHGTVRADHAPGGTGGRLCLSLPVVRAPVA
ncbi:MAG: tetratricopeptide repeat protein [Anaerolineae bacterium]|jgi:signal transduction histidine kinase|nr:tetratricopeptide repeat protein [Anaerolineae bacterium]